MRENAPLGQAERVVLEKLRSRGGVWTQKDGALWENKHWTVLVLCSLACKKLVYEASPGQRFELIRRAAKDKPKR